MTWFDTILVLACAFLGVFWEAAFPGLRHLLGAQIDLLPALMVYAALRTHLRTVCLLALLGGLWFDSLSANPLGITVLPLLIIGVALYNKRELVVKDQPFAQSVLGLIASAAVPALALVLLLSTGQGPVLGWGTLWQLTVMAIGGAIATPLFFVLFESLQRALRYSRHSQPSFRPDREIRRGR